MSTTAPQHCAQSPSLCGNVGRPWSKTAGQIVRSVRYTARKGRGIRRSARTVRLPAAAAAAAAHGCTSFGNLPATQRPEPPVLDEIHHSSSWHGSQRRDEYRWLTELGPTHLKVLSYLKAESQYTINCMAHTRQLQLQLQQAINSWQQQQQPDHTCSRQQQQQQVDGQLPDCIAGRDWLSYQQYKSFGWPGRVVGQYRLFSVAVQPGSDALVHCRAPAAAAAAAPACNDTISAHKQVNDTNQQQLPVGTMALWNEARIPSSSSSKLAGLVSASARSKVGGKVHSLAISPCGSFLAVTYSSNHGRSWQLTVVCCETGGVLLAPVDNVDGPALWVQQQQVSLTQQMQLEAAAAAADSTAWQLQQNENQQQQQQFLVFVAKDYRQVYCLAVPPKRKRKATAAAAAAVGGEVQSAAAPCCPAAAPQLIFQDPQHVSVNIAAAAGETFITVYGADGLMRQVLMYCGSSSNSTGETVLLPTRCEAWHLLLPAHTLARLLRSEQGGSSSTTGTADAAASFQAGTPELIPSSNSSSISAGAAACQVGAFNLFPSSTQFAPAVNTAGTSAAVASAGDADPTVRVAVVCQGEWLVLRRSCAAAPQGKLLLASLSRQQQQQRSGLQWHMLLPAQQDLFLEAVFVSQQPKSCRGSSSGSTDEETLQVVVLSIKHQQQQQQNDGSSSHVRVPVLQQLLHAQLYHLNVGAASDKQQGQQQHWQWQQQQQQRMKLQPQCCCTLPVPDASFQLHGASWHPSLGELKVEFSSLVRPITKLTVKLQQYSKQQQQQKQSAVSGLASSLDTVQAAGVATAAAAARPPPPIQAAAAAVAGESLPVVTLHQLQPAPDTFQQSAYCTAQIGVPSNDGTIVPLSLAWHKRKANLPQHVVDAVNASSNQCSSTALDISTGSTALDISTGSTALDISTGGTAGGTGGDCTTRTTGSTVHCSSTSPAFNSSSRGSNYTSSSSSSSSSDTGSTTGSGSPAAALPPMLLSCYGSYGIKESVAFKPELLQLLDAGWVLAVVHVRGGGWLGRAWAEAGRGESKPTGVADLLAVGQYVRQAGLCAPTRLCLAGASAGGWLAASVLLQQPHWFAAAVLTVPCLDPLGLLLEQQHGELELGPAATDAQVYHSITSWAPYDLLEQLLQAQADPQQQSVHNTSRQAQQQQHGSLAAGVEQQSPPQQHQQQQQYKSLAAGVKRYHPQQLQGARLPHVLVRAALHDAEVPISNPVRALARMRKLNLRCQQKHQEQQQTEALNVLDRKFSASSSAGVAAGGDCLLLLRVVPGGHLAFEQDCKEAALKLAFLLDATSKA